MTDFIVKAELPPARCEICHKSDQFDKEKNICLRCENININKAEKTILPNLNTRKIDLINKKVISSFIISSSILIVGLTLIKISHPIWFFLSSLLSLFFAFVYNSLTLSSEDLIYWTEAPPKFSPSSIGDFVNLDNLKLQQYSFEIKALGFIRLGDYKIDYFENGEVFSRIFFHPKYKCFALLRQPFFSKGRTFALFPQIISNFQGNWSLSSMQNVTNVLIDKYIFRLPKRLWINSSESTIKELLESHINFRNNMIKTLEINLLPETSLKEFFEVELKKHQETKELYKNHKLIYSLKDRVNFYFSSRDKWLGDYKP